MAGRATALTPAVQQRIVNAIRGGLFIEQAARLGGIPPATYYRWIAQAEADPSEEPPIAGKPFKELKALVANNGLTIKGKITRQACIDALEHAGIGSWRIYREFRDAIAAAEVELEARLVAELQIAFPKNPALIKEMLARRFPARWSPTQNVALTGANGGPVQFEQSDERRLAEQVQAYLKGREDATAEQQPKEKAE